MKEIYVAGGKKHSHATSVKHESSKETNKKEVEAVEDHDHLVGGGRHVSHHQEGSLLSAFCQYPKGIRFIGADSREHIVLLLRKHWVTNLKWFVFVCFMCLLPFLVLSSNFLDQVPERFQIIGLLFWYLATMAYALEQFLSWFFNVYIVTDERVFDVDFHNLVYRQISDANLDQIQDVTSTIGGVIRTALNYGDVVIQTSAEIVQIEFMAVPKPDRVAAIIRELRVEEEQEKIEGRVR